MLNKKIFIKGFLFFLLLQCKTIDAQVKASLGTFLGYESNINKNPEQFLLDGVLMGEEKAYQNSFFQEVCSKIKYTKEWRKSDFKLYASPKARLFFSEPKANHWTLPLRIQFNQVFKKNIKWENNLKYKLRKRDGFDLDENELSIPFGYSDYLANTGIHFRLFKNNRTYVKGFYGIRDFDKSTAKDVKYNKYGGVLSSKKVFWKNHLQHSYGVKFGFANRNYTIKTLSDGKMNKRNWQYIDAELFYKYPLSKKTFIQPSISYQKRMDKSDSKYGYEQWKPAVKFSYKKKCFLIGLNASYALRIFNKITAKNSNDVVMGGLKYKYLKMKLNVEHPFLKKWYVTGEAYLNNRISNNVTNTTTAYRSYDNYYYGIGLKFKF